MLTKFQVRVLKCGRILTDCHGAFTIDGLRKYKLGYYPESAIKEALEQLCITGDIMGHKIFYRTTRHSYLTRKAEELGDLLVPVSCRLKDVE